jgi:hypothetical protein
MGKAERKMPLGKSSNMWGNTNKMDLKENGWEGWTGFFWLRRETKIFVNMIINLRVP